ncbi:MAG: ATP-binding cassette domain-containing protein [Actinomycetales bacterium]|nr:ATP-binding cassette domain-containing protein [Actinomycetales bacterium]
MIVEACGLTKRYGKVTAVDDLSFTVRPGHITGFLGPNGSGKSTTLRLMMGLDHGDGSTLFDGRRLREHAHVTRVVGAHLDAKSFHPGRPARAHLRMLGSEARVGRRRVDEVIDLVGLGDVARGRPRGFSLGMCQRLGLASAILAQPAVLIIDEPANGLDPQSIHWLRDFLTTYAHRGAAVLISSHLLAEMQLMADHLVVIGQGRLIADESMADFVARSARNDVLVRCSNPLVLRSVLAEAGLVVHLEGVDGLAVSGSTTDRIGDLAFQSGVSVREMVSRHASLEQAFLDLTSGVQDFAAGAAPSEGTSA